MTEGDPQITQIFADYKQMTDERTYKICNPHPSGIRSGKLNATRCDSVNLTRQAVTSEFHGAGAD